MRLLIDPEKKQVCRQKISKKGVMVFDTISFSEADVGNEGFRYFNVKIRVYLQKDPVEINQYGFHIGGSLVEGVCDATVSYYEQGSCDVELVLEVVRHYPKYNGYLIVGASEYV